MPRSRLSSPLRSKGHPILARFSLLAAALLLAVAFSCAVVKTRNAPPLSKDNTSPALATDPHLKALALSHDDILEIIHQNAGTVFSSGGGLTDKIALTFDDGPDPVITPQILAILKREQVEATFFMIGKRVQAHPEVAKMVADAGFEVGCHTYNHPILTRLTDPEAIRREIVSSQDVIEQATGLRPFLFRPPGGAEDGRVRAIAAQNNLVVIKWNVGSTDWQSTSTVGSIFDTTTRNTHDGAIILMHDTHEKTVQVLPRLIAAFKARAYDFATISDLLADADVMLRQKRKL